MVPRLLPPVDHLMIGTDLNSAPLSPLRTPLALFYDIVMLRHDWFGFAQRPPKPYLDRKDDEGYPFILLYIFLAEAAAATRRSRSVSLEVIPFLCILCTDVFFFFLLLFVSLHRFHAIPRTTFTFAFSTKTRQLSRGMTRAQDEHER